MIGTAQPWVRTSVNVSPEFHTLCKQHHIQFGEALRVGISLLLADKGVVEYSNNIQVVRKITSLREQLEEISQKYYELKENETG